MKLTALTSLSPPFGGDDRSVVAWQSVAVNQQPSSGWHYPFLWQAESAGDERYVLGDLWLAYADDTDQRVLPFRVAWLYGFGPTPAALPGGMPTPTHARDIVIVDAENVTVFDSTTADSYIETDRGHYLATVQWLGGETALRLTRHLQPPPETGLPSFKTNIVPANGELDPRTWYRLPLRVRSLRVGATRFEPGRLVLTEGFNVRLTPELADTVDGGRRVRRVRIRAKPGDGLGRVPGCTDVVPVLRRVNGAGPSASGNLVLDALDCYRMQRPVTITAGPPRQAVPAFIADPGSSVANLQLLGYSLADARAATALASLRLFNDCDPCCECDDFVNTYEGIRRLWDRCLALGQRAEATRDLLASNIDRWDAQRACRMAQSLRLVLNADPRCRLFTGGSHCNMTTACLSPVVLRMTFETFNDGTPSDMNACAEVKCRESYRNAADTAYDDVSFTPQGSWPVFDIPFEQEDPGGLVSFRTRFKLCCEAGGLDVVQATLSIHMPDQFDALGQPVALPDPDSVDVPAGVLALWAVIPPPYPVRAVLTKTVAVSATSGCGGC